MAREFDPSKHPGDRPGAYQRALVVNIQDPENRGRVACRLDTENDLTRVPDEKLVWSKVQGSTDHRATQASGAQHGLTAGCTVEVSIHGPANQDRVVRGSIPNDKEGENQSKHPAEDGKDKVFADEDRHSKKFGWKRQLAEVYKIKSTQEARKVRDEENRFANYKKEPIEESRDRAKTRKEYKERAKFKDAEPNGGDEGVA